MSSSNTNPPPPAGAHAITRDMWDDTTTDLNENRMRKNIPPLPEVRTNVQVVKSGGMETVAYMLLQVKKTDDKAVVMRALASICSILLSDPYNFTGSPAESIVLTGLAAITEPDAASSQVLSTNFEDAEDVTIGEILELMDGDSDELGAYAGWMFYASQKQLSQYNASAFNERRQAAATASLISDRRIFVDDSPYLSRDIIRKLYGSFLSYSPWRAHMITRVVGHMGDALTGPALAFSNMFLLLVDNGMAALKIIKEAVMRHPWIRTDFPELVPDLRAANEAQNILRQAPGTTRSFLKAIHGQAFVPVNYSQIDNLLGVCKEILKRTIPSYSNFGGGKITESQLERINSHLATKSTLIHTVASE